MGKREYQSLWTFLKDKFDNQYGNEWSCIAETRFYPGDMNMERI